MSLRELVALGTSSAAPTRHRNHNGYALRWDDQMIFFDPGEGFQRQCTIGNVAIARGNAVCLTHFHGDHCLGLPGLIARRGLDRCPDDLQIFYPAEGEVYYERLRTCTASSMQPNLRPRPVTAGPIGLTEAGMIGKLRVQVAPLDHRVPVQGYRITEPDSRRFVASLLSDAGISGPIVGKLAAEGSVDGPNGVIRYEDVSESVAGQSFAFVMDSRFCDAGVQLAEGVDMLVCESTYLELERKLADQYAHMTAADAGRMAAAAGAKKLVLTHFSARYNDLKEFEAEAGEYHPNVVAVRDFDHVSLR